MTGSAGEGLRILDLRRSFGSVEVLKGVNIEFLPGEVHAFLGANGAGKSTLLGCLGGALYPTSGIIQIGGREHAGFTPREAFDAGTGIIYQHFQLAPSLSVADNVFLADEITNTIGVRRRREMERETAAILSRLDVHLDPSAPVESLSIGQQQIVEIARAIRRDPPVLILDEPTAALGKHEVSVLLALVKRLAHEHNMAVVFVTHLLGEVMEVADRVSILHNGEILWTRAREDVSLRDLAEGVSPDASALGPATARQLGDELVRFEDFRTSFCGPLNLSLAEGEIVGVFALLGGGRTNLLETISGARAKPTGTFAVDGRPITVSGLVGAIRSGIALVASDRSSQSLFGSLTALENLLMPSYRSLSRFVRSSRRESRIFGSAAERVQLSPLSPGAEATSFSGGNAQKLVVGRWLTGVDDIKLLLLDEPTQGVDIGSRGQIYGLLREFASSGRRSILFATSDPEEAIALADRIVVLVEGRVAAVVEPPTTESELLAIAQSVDISDTGKVPVS